MILIVPLEVTQAERRVVEALMLDGADNETIARRCEVSRNTVKTHLAVVMRRAGTPNRAALVLAIERGELAMRTVPWRARRRACEPALVPA